MGGGVVAEIFRDRRKPGRFSGGGVVAEIFRDRRKPGRFSGGGVVAEIVGLRPYQTHSIRLPQFREFFWTFPGHLEITRN